MVALLWFFCLLLFLRFFILFLGFHILFLRFLILFLFYRINVSALKRRGFPSLWLLPQRRRKGSELALNI